jgi:hypothetical protein
MSLYQKTSLVQIPSGYKAADAKLYSVVPNSSDGDFTVSSDADATRVNKDGLIQTTVANQARLNYDPTNPQDPHLLLEPTRTNSLTYSEDFTNAAYSKQGTSSVTGNTTIAPDGSLTADTLSGATGTDVSGNVLRRNVSGTVDATLSIYVKSLGSTSFTIYIRNGSSGAVQSQSITPNDTWQRVTLTSNPNNGQIFFGNTNGDVAIWGAQLEEGSYPTSYIQTTTAAVTRTADDAHLLNQTLITDYPFTAYTNAKIEAVGNAIFSLNNTSSQNYYLVFYFPNSTQIGLLRRDLSNSDNDFYNFSYSIGDTIKVAVAFISATEYKLYINGTEIADVTSGTSIPFNHDDISLGQFRITGDTGTRNSINEFMLFNEALTDAELITLTT